MTQNVNGRNEIVTVLILLLFFTPIIAVAAIQNPVPSVTVQLGEEVDVSESLLISSEEYSPSSFATIINDTSIEVGNVWIGWYNDNENTSTFERYVNVPLRNTTEIIFGASFSVERGPREISIHNIEGENSTVGYSGQNTTLILRIPPDAFWDYQYSHLVERIPVFIDIEGDYRDGIAITGFWVQAVLNATVYPVSVDIQRTNGVSLYSNPTMRPIHYLDSLPTLSFMIDNSSVYGRFSPTQVNDTVLLPSGNYTLFFRWSNYETNSSFDLSEDTIHLVWRVRSVRVDVIPTRNVPGYLVGVSHSLGYDTFLLTESPSYYIPSERNVTIDVQGGWWSTHYTTSTGRNLNITAWVESNTIILGPFAFAPGRLALLFCLLLMICISGFAVKKRIMSSTKLIPFSFLVLSYILHWFHYISKTSFPWTIPREEYLIYWAFSPGTSSMAQSTSDSLILVSHSVVEILPLIYFLLFVSLAGVLFGELEFKRASKYSNHVFAFSLCSILIMEIAYVGYFQGHSVAIYHLAVMPGIAPFIVILALISWLVLHRRKAAQLTTG